MGQALNYAEAVLAVHGMDAGERLLTEGELMAIDYFHNYLLLWTSERDFGFCESGHIRPGVTRYPRDTQYRGVACVSTSQASW